MLIFCAILIYVIIFVIVSLNTERIIPYEVREGSLAINYTYRALAIRDEEIITTDKAGYINYFAREGERVSPGNLVYIIDETGELKEYLENESMENTSLSNDDLIEIRSDIVNFVHYFDEKRFHSLYDFKYDIKNTVMKLSNTHLYDSIDSINNSSFADSIAFRNAGNTGIITYYVDGFEELQPENITMDMFDEEKYNKKQILDNQLVTIDEPAYKISKNENWSILLPIDESLSQDFLDEEYIKVRFLKNQYESWGKVSIIKGADAETYLQLTFTNSMVTFAKDRFIDIELLLHEETGLKIPNTSIVNKEFYLIPRKYITKMDESSDVGSILLETYKDDGTITTTYREIDIYSYDEETGEYYIDSNILQSGSNLLMADSQEKYTVSRKGTLIGVYYMNKGYADFRQIQILYQNDEYSIVKSNTDYGLNVYDYVVLNSNSVHEEQFIYN
ncbi:MAG: hypothetical protein IKB01_13595 [Lachnospiraceae bacterium]|nr:hypothetical protein [Lachnospiraceae bacterium]MBR4085244.1 hypothetical protein [Lachnospiraceae bacterium]